MIDSQRKEPTLVEMELTHIRNMLEDVAQEIRRQFPTASAQLLRAVDNSRRRIPDA